MSHEADGDRSIDEVVDEIQRRRIYPRTPKRIGVAVAELMARNGYARQQESNQWTEIWNQTAGGFATCTRVGRLRAGVLTVYARNSAVLQELTFQKSVLLGNLRQSSLGNGLADLKFRIGPIE
ncbi:MAG: DUF721 domain-containing protein [Pirellulaceae bacterium]|nr:DUF721 domain-containing protein [Pirellulaceae bacterium]